ncbi:MAG: lipopolysaccharide biosynthesis protein [bacterium]
MDKNISIKKAATISMISKYSVVFIQLFYSVILARILTPEDYGIVAIINVFVAFFSILANMGIGNAIIQNQELNKEDINSIFSFSIYMGILLAIAFALLSIPISSIYSNNVYLKIGPLLSISVFFSTINMVPNALLLKEKKFFIVGVRQVIVSLLCSIATIVLAVWGFKYYALVLYSILSAIFTFLWNFKNVKLNFMFKISMDSLNKVKQFSMFLFGFNIMNYFSRNLDNLLIGKYMGSALLGNYNKAYQLMLYPLNYLTHVITPVLLPLISSYQDDLDYVYKQYLKVVKVLSIIGIYITVFCFFSSKEIVLILFGSRWVKTIHAFRFLSLSIWFQMISATSGSMFQVLDKTRTQFVRGIYTVSITIIAILIGIKIGSISTVSFFVMLAYIINFVSMVYFLVYKSFNKSWLDYLKKLFPDLIIGGLVSISLIIASIYSYNNIFLSFIIKSLVSISVYLVGVKITNQFYVIYSILPSKVINKINKWNIFFFGRK